MGRDNISLVRWEGDRIIRRVCRTPRRFRLQSIPTRRLRSTSFPSHQKQKCYRRIYLRDLHQFNDECFGVVLTDILSSCPIAGKIPHYQVASSTQCEQCPDYFYQTPSESGYLMIPILAGMMLGLFLQGIGTSTFGYYAPFMIFASICMPIAAGLMTTYNVDTSLTQIILYSGLVGFSGGIGFQGPQAAVQTMLPPADINLGIGVILFGQSVGPAVFIAIAQVIFMNQLSSNLESIVPGLTPAYIEERGLGDIKNGVPVQHLDAVLRGIDRSLTSTWYLPVALGCMSIVGSLLIEWRSVKQKQT